MKKLLLILPLLLLVFTVSAYGTDIFVPSQYATIQAAVDAAVNGDNIIVSNGTYIENITITGKNVKIVSVSGRSVTTIQGIPNAGKNGTVSIAGPTNGFQLGDIGQGFTIIGIDNGASGIENAAVYFIGGSHTNNIIKGNDVRANGDEAFMCEYNADVTYFTIDNNIFSGQTFVGANPGIGDQWTVPNIPRQIVVMGGGSGGTNTHHITFTNNNITGISGGLTTGGLESGNTLVTIDADNSVVTGNTFNGTTKKWQNTSSSYSLRIRRGSTTLTGNTFNSSGLSSTCAHLLLAGQTVTPSMISSNTFDRVVYILGTTGIGFEIQPLINVVTAGTTIYIGAGIYFESVTINKSIILIGTAGAIIQAPATLPASNDPLSNIILVTGSGVNAEITGLTIKGPGTSNCGSMGRGIFVRDGANANIHDNQILDIRDAVFSGCQNGIAIQVGRMAFTTSGTATITNNLIQGYQKGGIVVDNTGSSATITGNTITGAGTTTVTAQNGIQISRGAAATLSGNTVTGNSFHLTGNSSDWGACGILLYQSGAVSLTGGNNLSGNDNNYYATGVTGNLNMGAEIFGTTTSPLAVGYQIALDANYNINAISCTFDGINPASASLSQLFAIEDRIWHSVDNNTTSGVVRIKAGNLYLTQTETGSLIQNGINAATTGDILNVAAGTYNESVNINKAVIVSGENRDNVIIKGPKTLAQTVILSAGCTLEKVTVTRDGNNVTDWASNANSSGVIFAQGVQNATLQNVKVTENRNGVYLNNTLGNTVKNCLITNNRTGVQYVNDVSNTLFENNEITNNWTVGFVIYYAGVLTPTLNCVSRNNNISGNWYSGVDCKTSLGNPIPTVSYNFAYNWWGTPTLNVVTTPAGEPGYASQIPVQFGGSAVPPGGNEGKISGDLSAKINYTPWIGSLESIAITNANLNTPVNFTTANTNLTFTSLPPATNATVSVQRIESSTPPAGVPAFPPAAGSGLPLYLMITATGLTNYTFSVTVVVDVSNIAGFTAGSKVMYFSTASNSWVGIEGLYNPTAKTFTFTTDHFTPFGFVNPTNPNDIYMSQDVNNPVTTQKWYPAVGMGDPAPSPDWKYTNATATFYVVPTGTTGMFSSKFTVVWDKTKANLMVEAGNYWTAQQYFGNDSSVGNNGRYKVEMASTDLTNQVPGGGKYLAKLNFTNIKPGYMPVSIDGTEFRYYHAGDSTSGVYATTHPGKILFYLGDVAKSGDETIGDGKITGADLSLFSSAYWSLNTHPNYKFKYDIGPTNANGSYWALPNSDGRIEFEDLNIFAIGYGKTGSGQLPDNPGDNKMKVSTLAMKYENGYFKVPVKVSGVVNDFRSGSFEFAYSSSELEFAGFEKKGGFEGDDNFMLSKTENNKIMLDAAIVGAEKDGMNGEQVIMNLLFTEKQSGNHNVNVLTARARNSSNTPIEITLDGNGISSEIPTTFSLNQNYPNPFNPSTTIKYGLPNDTKVSLVVFDMLGRKVMTLVNDNQKAGYHEVQFNALNLSSGTYFYRIMAGDFTSIKRMILIK
ncbi:MAG: right-handed parallel beta-helix repeat-containing protein [Ignavibacteria bacterium]